MQSFSIVEDQGFRELLAGFDPGYVLPHRTTLSKQLLPALYDTSIITIKDMLNSAEFITLTTDMWTSCTTESYMSITCHFIDESWTQKSALLGCVLFLERHTAANIKIKIDDLLLQWDVQKKVHTIVTDNGANIVAACRQTNLNHLPCLAHTINLIVQDAIKMIKPIHVKTKAIVEFFNRSTVAAAKLKHFQEQLNHGVVLKLKNDIVTRWNSTFFMFQRMGQLKECINAALGVLDNSVERLSSEEWTILNELCQLLEPFELVTVELSSDQHVTASKIIAIIDGLTKALLKIKAGLHSDCGLNLFNELLSGINKRFDKLEFNLNISIPTFLDPRFKKRSFSNLLAYNKAKESIIKNVTDMLRISQKNESQAQPQTIQPVTNISVKRNLIWEDFDNRENLVTTLQSTAVIEVRHYCEEIEVNRNEDPLKWWKSRELIYPRLAKLARKHLSVVATSVPSERVFSKSGQILIN